MKRTKQIHYTTAPEAAKASRSLICGIDGSIMGRPDKWGMRSGASFTTDVSTITCIRCKRSLKKIGKL